MTDADEAGSPLADEGVDPVWTAVRALLSANAATTAALEHLCVRAARGGELEAGTARRLTEAAVDEHRLAHEDLEFALAAVADAADEPSDP